MLVFPSATAEAQSLTRSLVSWTHTPQPGQCIPRDPATNTGRVEFRGTLQNTRFDWIRLRVRRDGRTLWLTSMPLTGTRDGEFRLQDRLPAGAAAYDLEVELLKGEQPARVLTVAQVVVGDVILIQGGVNAAAARNAGTAEGERRPLVRSFGTRSRDPERTAEDRSWHQAEGDADEGPGAVGQWALRMGRCLLDATGIPIALLNGAAPESSPMDDLPDPLDHEDLTTSYGRLLYRARRAGLAGSARLMIWYPDEWDQVDGETCDRAFRDLRRHWMRDYPALERIYVFQTRPGCGRDPWDVEQRERQRRWGEEFDDVTVLSTTGIASHDGCRFAFTGGYASIGDQAARLWGRDGYGDDRIPAVDSPRPLRAAILDPGGREVILELQTDEHELRWEAGAEADFRIDGSTARVVQGEAEGARLRLILDAAGFDATGLTFAGHSGAGGRVINQNGSGLVSFSGFPIDLPPPPAPTGLSAHVDSCEQIELAWELAAAAAAYRVERDGEWIADTPQPGFIDVPLDPDTWYRYRLVAVNRGGESAFAGPVQVRTPPIPGPPDVPGDISARALSNREIEVRWSPAANASSYVVRRNQRDQAVVFALSYVDGDLEPGTNLVYQVAGANPGSTSRFSHAVSITLNDENVFARVPEAQGYVIVYDLRLPADLSLDAAGQVIYDRAVPMNEVFDRVAYYLELQSTAYAPMQWVYVSMDAWTNRIDLLGVPTLASGARFQQPVANLRVLASPDTGLAAAGTVDRGWIEFWGRTYSTGNAAGVPGADPDRYDAGDEINLAGLYGSMQLHFLGREPTTVFAYNGWASSGTDDIGIGSAPLRHPDWTFAANADGYVHRRLQVLVRPARRISPADFDAVMH